MKNPDEQRVIAMVRHLYFDRRLPMRDVVAELQAAGIVTRRGSPFTLPRVCEILHMAKKPPPEAGG